MAADRNSTDQFCTEPPGMNSKALLVKAADFSVLPRIRGPKGEGKGLHLHWAPNPLTGPADF